MSSAEIDNQECQAEEILVLQSIYPSEFSILSEKKIRIRVSPCEIESEAHGINILLLINPFDYSAFFK
jgi:hypothetical protein